MNKCTNIEYWKIIISCKINAWVWDKRHFEAAKFSWISWLSESPSFNRNKLHWLFWGCEVTDEKLPKWESKCQPFELLKVRIFRKFHHFICVFNAFVLFFGWCKIKVNRRMLLKFGRFYSLHHHRYNICHQVFG